MGKVRALRARVHRAAVRPDGEAAPGLVPRALEPALPQASAGGAGAKVRCGARVGRGKARSLLSGVSIEQEPRGTGLSSELECPQSRGPAWLGSPQSRAPVWLGVASSPCVPATLFSVLTGPSFSRHAFLVEV